MGTPQPQKPFRGSFMRIINKGLSGLVNFGRRITDQIRITIVETCFDLLDRVASRVMDFFTLIAHVVWILFTAIALSIFSVLRYLQMAINIPRSGLLSFSVVGSMQPSFSGLRKLMSPSTIESLPLIPLDSSGDRAHIIRNAYILSEYARLAYEPKSTIHEICTKTWGFQHDNILFLDLWGTQAFVCACNKFIVVSFRGTEPFNIFDWLTDSKFRMRAICNPPKNKNTAESKKTVSKSEFELPKVHHGFLEALDVDGLRNHPNSAASWLQVREMILSMQATLSHHTESNGSHIPVFVTGHSLGAALATLFVQKMIDMGEKDLISGLYTFGSPRCGNLAFARQFNSAIGKRCFRFVLDEDIVPTLPISELDQRCKYNPAKHKSIVHHALDFLRHKISTPVEFVHVGNECLIEKWPEPRANFRALYPVASTKEETDSASNSQTRSPSHRVSWSKAVFEAPNPTLVRMLTRILLPSYIDDHFPTDYSHYLLQLVK